MIYVRPILKYILLYFFIINSLQATELDKIVRGDTLEIIAKRNVGRVQTEYGKDYKKYAKDLKEWNSDITDWNNPPLGQLIYVDSPALFNYKISLYGFYAASFGSYSEITGEQTVKSGQNFPVTFGLGFNATNQERVHTILGSFYWAQSSKGNVTGNSDAAISTFTIPGEKGANLYYQYFIKEGSFGIYTGYDFEKLNTFNTDKLMTGSQIENIDNNIHYLTVGMSKRFTVYNFKMNLKASVSKTLASSTSGSKALTGTKYIVYYTYSPAGRFNFSVFYKHHSLKGPTELSIARIGFSIGLGLLVF